MDRRFTAAAPLAIVGAMDEEIAPLLQAAEAPSARAQGPFTWHAARLDGVDVLLAVCGVGKVNAAALSQALLAQGAAAVIFTGVAGGVDPRLQVGDLVVASDALQHDVDVTGLGYEPGQVPGEPLAWAADPVLRDLLHAAAEAAVGGGGQVLVGRVVSGDAFVADAARVSDLRERFGAACTEMEGAAVAQVCARWGVPWAIVRSISDTADHQAQVDFRSFTLLAAQRAVAVVRGVLGRLGGSA